MSLLTIEMAKLSQRISGSEEDETIELWLSAAEEAAEQFLDRKLFKDKDTLAEAVISGEAGLAPMVITPMIKAAILLTFGKLYANREDVIIGTISSELPGGARHLLQPYRQGMGV